MQKAHVQLVLQVLEMEVWHHRLRGLADSATKCSAGVALHEPFPLLSRETVQKWSQAGVGVEAYKKAYKAGHIRLFQCNPNDDRHFAVILIGARIKRSVITLLNKSGCSTEV